MTNDHNERRDPFRGKPPFNSEAKKIQDYHSHSDLDSGRLAQHHTLGAGPNQAAPGNHQHNGTAPLGSGQIYFGTQDPNENWLIADGRELLRADYAALLAEPGLAFADGPSGSDYFVLPNPQDKFLLIAGALHALGTTGGSFSHTLTAAELPTHVHGAGTLTTSSNGGHDHNIGVTSNAGGGPNVVRGQIDGSTGHADIAGPISNNGDHTHNVTGDTGTGVGLNNDPVDITNPFLSVNLIIRVK